MNMKFFPYEICQNIRRSLKCETTSLTVSSTIFFLLFILLVSMVCNIIMVVSLTSVLSRYHYWYHVLFPVLIVFFKSKSVTLLCFCLLLISSDLLFSFSYPIYSQVCKFVSHSFFFLFEPKKVQLLFPHK